MSEPFYALAVDPSLNNTGYAVCKISEKRKGYKVEVVEVAHIPNSHFPSANFGYKLEHIMRRLYELRDVYHPVWVAKEDIGSHQNVDKIAPVHGLVYMIFRDIEIIGYAPTEMKKAIAGTGTAEKGDIMSALKPYIDDKTLESSMNLGCWHTDDESDACGLMLMLLRDKGIVV